MGRFVTSTPEESTRSDNADVERSVHNNFKTWELGMLNERPSIDLVPPKNYGFPVENGRFRGSEDTHSYPSMGFVSGFRGMQSERPNADLSAGRCCHRSCSVD